MTQPPFSQPRVQLADCTLTRALSTTDAALLSSHFAACDPWLKLGISASCLKNYLLREDANLYRYRVQVDEQLAGIICLRYPWLRGPYIELLGLIECYRGQGVGTQLLHWLESEARQHSKNIWLVSSSFNHTALQFYQRQGFQKIGVIEGLVQPDYDELLLRKRLDGG
jgi:ribosomal protein S18 acetylase RimI-like enzyme